MCFERPTLILYVWRPAETGVREPNNPTERAETCGSSDSSNSQASSSSPPVCSFVFPRSGVGVGGSPKLCFACMFFFLAPRLRVKHTISINKH